MPRGSIFFAVVFAVTTQHMAESVTNAIRERSVRESGQIVRSQEITEEDLLRLSAERMRVSEPVNNMDPTSHGGSSLLSILLKNKKAIAARSKQSTTRWEQLEAYTDSNRALNQLWLEHTKEGPSLSDLITADKWKVQMDEFLGITRDRTTGGAGADKAAAYIEQRMKDAGLNVETQSWSLAHGVQSVLEKTADEVVDGADSIKGEPVDLTKASFAQALEGLKSKGASPNVMGKLDGSDDSNNCYYVLGAHYDSVNHRSDKEAGAPGADDNASGVTSLLTIMDVFTRQAHSSKAPTCSVYFVAFSGEEQGLLGSEAFVRSQVESGKLGTFAGAILMDQVGYKSKESKSEVIFETSGRKPQTDAIVDTLAKSADTVGGIDKYHINYHGFGSDHMSFLHYKQPAVLVIEREDEDYAHRWGHSSEDTPDHIDHEFGAKLARLTATALSRMAGNTPSSQADTETELKTIVPK